MARAEITKRIPVSKEKLMQVITRYEDYPQFVEYCSKTEVERKASGRARVKYSVNLMKEVSYTIDLEEAIDDGKVSWALVESAFFAKNEGGWEVSAISESECEARYWLDVEFKVKVPGFVLKKLVKGNLPSMVEAFSKRAQSV